MFSDPQFWVAVSFILFIAVIFNPVRKILTSSLDAQIKDIKNKIDEVENLKNEAQKALDELKDREICIMGFTWLLYTTIIENEKNDTIRQFFKSMKNTKIIHIGGWKKLSDNEVSKEEFNQKISEFFNCEKENIIDIYGITEQLGTIYRDCAAGNKHVSVFSEIFIRNIETLEIEDEGKSGFIQLVSPIPHSYPGVSLLSDDIGRILGVDNCPCGRKGKYFRFEKRTEQADIKGCGDTIS